MSFSSTVSKARSSSSSRDPRSFAIVFLKHVDKCEAMLARFRKSLLNTLHNDKNDHSSVNVVVLEICGARPQYD